jgi:hypothetical protein
MHLAIKDGYARIAIRIDGNAELGADVDHFGRRREQIEGAGFGPPS